VSDDQQAILSQPTKEVVMTKYFTGALLVAACVLSQTVCLADEEKSSSVTTSTPEGTASTTVKTKSDATGESTAVQKTKTTPGAKKTSTYKAKVGPGGAKVSKTKTKVQQNADGSVSAAKTDETHAVNEAGSVSKKTKVNQTTDIDGSTTKVKQESTSTTP
jgi:hypothetical protein